MNLLRNNIAVNHANVLRESQNAIFNRYPINLNNQMENQITIIYDTMWNGTKIMADNISKGIREFDKDVKIKIFKASYANKSEIITEVCRSKAILVGSPPIMKGIMSSISDLLEEIGILGLKNRKAGAFGSYGFGGESAAIISEMLKSDGFGIVEEEGEILWNSNEMSPSMCFNFGKKFARLTNMK